MAFSKSITQRLFNISRVPNPPLTNFRVSSSSMAVKSAAFRRQGTPDKLDHDPGDDGVFRRCFHLISASAASPELGSFLNGERLLEKFRGMDVVKDRSRIGEVSPLEEMVTLAAAKKILMVSQIEIVKSTLRKIEKGCVSYTEFLQICVQECSNHDQGIKFAELLDESGAVLVLGDFVFLRPEQVMKTIQDLIPSPAAHNPNDRRMKQLQEMEKRKIAIDEKAEHHVRRELFCGLACLVIQTAAVMRLTFWELTWDVMEPICFYGTSIYFIGRYGFFLRTSKEPSFRGFFQSRFSTKQRQLMKLQNFDVERYNELKKACHPDQVAPHEHLGM
ncbi:calcium uniporter protein 2, mitochondrial-like [Primulina eburnea]|uniref:calcium uniporter protein 2, mitochondrial-like n=1 Tax=Primulina eburnea TaxID=1245227 RepID=UPI003C6CBF21